MSAPVPVPARAPLAVGQPTTDRVLEQHYELLDILGKGSFSVVHRAKHLKTGEFYACKLIDKWSIQNRQRLANEVRSRRDASTVFGG